MLLESNMNIPEIQLQAGHSNRTMLTREDKESKLKDSKSPTLGPKRSKMEESGVIGKSVGTSRLEKVEEELWHLRARFDKLLEYLFNKSNL